MYYRIWLEKEKETEKKGRQAIRKWDKVVRRGRKASKE